MFRQIRQDPGARGPCPLPGCVHWLAFDERPRWRNKVMLLMGLDMGVSENGGTQQPLVFLLKVIILGVWGYHHLRTHPYILIVCSHFMPIYRMISTLSNLGRLFQSDYWPIFLSAKVPTFEVVTMWCLVASSGGMAFFCAFPFAAKPIQTLSTSALNAIFCRNFGHGNHMRFYIRIKYILRENVWVQGEGLPNFQLTLPSMTQSSCQGACRPPLRQPRTALCRRHSCFGGGLWRQSAVGRAKN